MKVIAFLFLECIFQTPQMLWTLTWNIANNDFILKNEQNTHNAHKTFPLSFNATQNKQLRIGLRKPLSYFFSSDFQFGVYVNTNGDSAIFRVFSYTDGIV